MTHMFSGSLMVGFHATDNYNLLSDVQKPVFKQQFGEEALEELQDWFNEQFPTAMNDWDALELWTNDPSGYMTEASAISRITTKLNPNGASTPRFKVETGGATNVRYFYVNGKRVCQHMYALRRHDGSNYVPWKLPSAGATENVMIMLSWEHPEIAP